jgi:hypothetical protein
VSLTTEYNIVTVYIVMTIMPVVVSMCFNLFIIISLGLVLS